MAKKHDKKSRTKAPAKRASTDGKNLYWYFPSTGHGENDGFSDALLQHFEGDHEKYIAREAIQNSIDARLNPDAPVSVTFEHFSIKTSELPGHAELLDIMKRCLAFVPGEEKAEKFFKNAIKLLEGKNIPVLKISDYNTKGLSGGDDETAGNWYRLVKAVGTSNFKGVGGGSFGIGKGAPIAASMLHTVFYSSIDEEGHLVCQGKSRLVSHRDKDKDVRRGVGFFGIDGYAAIRKADLVPAPFKRSERGTDIFIIGYDITEDWRPKLVQSVLHNFWLTILDGNLELTIRDGQELTITKENLQECLEEYDAEDARFFYEAKTNSQNCFEANLKHIGEVKLYVRKNEGYPSRTMMVRKPKMLVQEKTSGGALREPYAAVFVCENDAGNRVLRDLEPPAHDEWDAARHPCGKAQGKAVLKELNAFIKESLKTMAESITSEPEDIPGLDRYLPDSEERDYMPSESGEAFEETGLSTDEESGREIGAERDIDTAGIGDIIRKSIVTNKQQGPVAHVPPEGPGNGSRGRATGQKNGSDDGVRINTSLISFRSFVRNSKDGMGYRIVITGREDCDGAIRIVATGDDNNYPVGIMSALDAKTGKAYKTGESLIKDLAVKAGETLKIDLKIQSANKYALGIESYEG